MATTEFRSRAHGPHRRRRGLVPRVLDQRMRHRLSRWALRAHLGRRHPVQLRAVLRVRNLLHGLQHGRGDHVELPRGWVGRRVPPLMSVPEASGGRRRRLHETRGAPRRSRPAHGGRRRRPGFSGPVTGRRSGPRMGAAHWRMFRWRRRGAFCRRRFERGDAAGGDSGWSAAGTGRAHPRHGSERRGCCCSVRRRRTPACQPRVELRRRVLRRRQRGSAAAARCPPFLPPRSGLLKRLGLVGVDLRLVGAAAPRRERIDARGGDGGGSRSGERGARGRPAPRRQPARAVVGPDAVRHLGRGSHRSPPACTRRPAAAGGERQDRILDLPASLRAAAGPGRGVVELVALEPFRPRTRVVQPPRGRQRTGADRGAHRCAARTPGCPHPHPWTGGGGRRPAVGPGGVGGAARRRLHYGRPRLAGRRPGCGFGPEWYRNHSQTLPDDAATTGAPDSPDEVEPAGAPPHAAAHDDETENP